MKIQDRYEAKQGSLVITYRLRDKLEDYEIADKFDALEKAEMSVREKDAKIYELLFDEILDVKGLTRHDGSEITYDDIKAFKCPTIVITKLLEIYRNHKASLLGVQVSPEKK